MSCFQFVILNCCFLFPTFAVMCLVAQSCPILCDPMDCSPARLLCPWGFSRQEYWSGFPCPPPGDLPNPRIKSALQVDSLLSEPPGKPKNTGVGSLSLLQGVFLTQESYQGLPHCRQILYRLSYQGSSQKNIRPGKCSESRYVFIIIISPTMFEITEAQWIWKNEY